MGNEGVNESIPNTDYDVSMSDIQPQTSNKKKKRTLLLDEPTGLIESTEPPPARRNLFGD